MMAEFSSSQ